MAIAQLSQRLNVFINGKLVGQLDKLSDGVLEFEYADKWIDWKHATPVSLSMPLRTDKYSGRAILAVLDNLLPDSFGTRRQLAEQLSANGTDAFSLLSEIGKDCVGALQFLPDGFAPADTKSLDATPLSISAIAQLLRDLPRNPLGATKAEGFCITLSGTQDKTALLFHNKDWLRPRGTTPTTHILKPALRRSSNQAGFAHSVENEFLCLLLLRNLGLPTASAEMMDFEDQRTLVVERFDRQWAEDGRILRMPQEDCCQSLSVLAVQKYEKDNGPSIPQILSLLAASDTPLEDQKTFLKAQIIFWMIGATDGHAKNFSIFLYPKGRVRMTPIYDVLSAMPDYAANRLRQRDLKLAMVVGRSRHYRINTITLRHFVESAAQSDIAGHVVEELYEQLLGSIPSAISNTEKQLPTGFPDEIAGPILSSLSKHVAA